MIHGLSAGVFRDLSHIALTASWPLFIAGATVAFIVLNVLFAAAFALGGPDAVASVPPGSFAHYVYFSIETLATVGYGDMHPQTHYGHLVASTEMFVGIFYAAVLTGLIFNRFARPRARIMFARPLTIASHEGIPTLMIRMANERHNAITNASAKLWFIRREVSAEGGVSRTFRELALLRGESPAFMLSWTIYHPIIGDSPLHGLGQPDLKQLDVSFSVVIDGYDENASQFVRARHVYGLADLRFGERFADILEPIGEGDVHVDYGRFHDTVPDARL